ncbi:MAG TPA: YfhO family protein [Pyrinomonadaceae bacterium]|jgi:hypothetical protein
MKARLHSLWRARRADAGALAVILVFFLCFFAWALAGAKFLVGGDAFAYSYPLRADAWAQARAGAWPVWQPRVLAGYPLLAMAQVGLAYPLTWGYLFLAAHRAEQCYVLAPFLLAPACAYAYVRALGRTRTAALLAGLTYAYGGATTNLLGLVGFHTNALLWLPLVLLGIERARRRPLAGPLSCAGAAYALSVLTGYGQGFVTVGLLALAYGAWLTLFAPREETQARRRGAARWRPLLTAAGALAIGAGVGAFQILETMRAVRRSIRGTLIYPFFVGGSFAPRTALSALFAPLYVERFADVTTYVAPLALLLALIAAFASVRPRATRTHVTFWLATAAASVVLILGRHTPLYGLLYHVPVVNSFRVPSRHAFEWTFAVAVLAAYGWDALAARLAARADSHLTDGRAFVLSLVLLALAVVCGALWWARTGAAAGLALHPLAGVPRAWLEGRWYAGPSVPAYLIWKAACNALVLAALWCAWRVRARRRRAGLLLACVVAGCFVEPYILVTRWWGTFAKTEARLTTPAAATSFLSARADADARVYTRVNLFAEEFSARPRFDPPNLTVRYGLTNVAGYEPLLLERYSRALGHVGLDAVNPLPGHPPDETLLGPRSHVLDLLRTRYVLAAELTNPFAAQIERDGIRLAAADLFTELPPAGRVTLTSGNTTSHGDALTNEEATGDTLALVTSLANSVSVPDDAAVARVRVFTDDGRVIERELRAGADTAEWAHERADVRANVKHRLASVFDSRPVDEAGGYAAHRYWTRLALGARVRVTEVEVENVSALAPLALYKATVYDVTTQRSLPLLLSQRSRYAALDPQHWRAVYDREGVLILENARALPRAWLVAEAAAVDGEEALRLIRGETTRDFDPTRTALLEVRAEELPTLPGGAAAGGSGARVVASAPARLTVETDAPTPTVLVVSDIFYPGWVATVDGRPAPILLTDYLLRGVALPAGRHTVEMRYDAPAARVGAFVSLATLALLGALTLYAARSRRARRDARS